MKTKTSKDMEIKDLLDSDDEFPSDYVETPYIPAYKNDDRFKSVQFNWKAIIKKNEEHQSHPSASNINIAKTEQSRLCYENEKLLKTGILHKNDIFLSKCIEMTDDTTLLWFVNFLIHKDLQSNYMFLKSCLVPKIQYDDDISDVKSVIENRLRQRYQFIVQM